MRRTNRGDRLSSATLLAALVSCTVAILPSVSFGQAGLGATKACDDSDPTTPGKQVVEGDTIDCDVSFEFIADTFRYTRVTGEAFNVPPVIAACSGAGGGLCDVIPFPSGGICTVRADNFVVSAPVNVPADAIEGNAVCSGASCNPATGAGCSLPCLVCEAGATESDSATGLTCPGGDARGEIHARHQGVAACTMPACGSLVANPFIDLASVEGLAVAAAGTQPAQGSGTDTIFCVPEGDLLMRKECSACDPETGLNTVSGTLTNDKSVDLVNCTIVDSLAGPLSPAGFALAAGATLTATGTVGPLVGATHNRITASCETATGDPVVAIPESPGADQDICPPCALTNFKCYKAKLELGTPFQRKSLPLVDQFGANSAVLVAPFEFCNPVDKNGEGIADPESHLMCYKMLSRRRVSERVVDRDQFGDEALVLASAVSLCLPAIKDGQGDLDDLQSRANHYQCYRARTARGTDPIPAQDVVLSDQFGSEVEHTTQQTSLHCNPVIEKGAEDVLVDLDAHLKCYDITAGASSPAIPPHVTVEDQFGEKNLVIGEAVQLCEPAVKTLATTLFAWEEFASNLYTIDTAGPTATFIGGPNSGIIAEIESRGGSIYAADTDDNTKLHRVDPATGLYKSTTTLTFPPEGNVLTSLEFVGSTLYAGLTTEGGGETYLSTVDLGSGVVTVVGGPSGVGSPLGGLAWNGATMYAISAGGSPAELFTIDLGSGVATSVGLVTLGGSSFGATALEFGADGVLYSLPKNDDVNAGHLLSIDPATGEATDLGDTGISGLVALTSRAR